MVKYIVDANLPYYLALWHSPEYVHVFDIGDTMSDEEIWHYAHINNLIIITKDVDFSLKVFTLGVPPKVIHIKFGNMKIKAFFNVMNLLWPDIENKIRECELVNVYKDKIETIKLNL